MKNFAGEAVQLHERLQHSQGSQPERSKALSLNAQVARGGQSHRQSLTPAHAA
jgi:hypothetical protein